METVAGRFVIRRVLGEGGMGAVYEVVDLNEGRTLALKRLLPQGHPQPEQLSALFQREFHTLSRLVHPAIIDVYEYGVDAAGPFYTMELLEGNDLRSLLPLPFEIACRVLRDVASALSLLHTRQLVHRDITCRNIRVLAAGRAKLLDFGALAPMGYSGSVVGTPPFVAPEAVFSQPLDARSDLFSVGVVLYQALTGQLPYQGRTWEEMRAAWQRAPVDAGVLVPQLPSELVNLTMALIAPNRSARPRSAGQVMEQLGEIAGVPASESPSVARSYLVAPDLVARDSELSRVRESLGRARQRTGGGLVVTGSAGVGRTRFLDDVMLEARMAGFVVLSAGAVAAADGPFAATLLLTQALFRAVPAVVARAVADNWTDCSILFREGIERSSFSRQGESEHDMDRVLRESFREIAPRRGEVIVALRTLFTAVAAECDLVVAVDDVSRVDEPSAAWLGALLELAVSHRILVVTSLEDPSRLSLSAAYRRILRQSQEISLRPFDSRETAALIRAVFGSVPNVDPLAGTIFQLSQGLPRDAMSLCEHLVDAALVGYRGGSFFLPASIEPRDLPVSLAEAHARVVRTLSPTAVRFGRALVLAAERSLILPDFMELSVDGDVGAAQLALDELVLRRIVASDGYRYRVVHEGWERALSADLDPAEARRLHRALANLKSAQSDTLLRIYHLFGDLDSEGLSLAIRFVHELGDERKRLEVLSSTRITAKQVSKLLELAVDNARWKGASKRELSELEHSWMMLGVYVDYAAFERMRPIVVEDLKRDSGYSFWKPPEAPDGPISAALSAITMAQAHFDALPAGERVRSPEEAIRALVEFAAAAIAVGGQASDWELRRSLPDLLRPFACLSPIVDAVFENCVAVRELSFGRFEAFRERSLAVLDRLSQVDIGALPHGEEIRSAVIYGVGSADARIGIASALGYARILEEHPRLGANAMDLRAYVLLQQGDWKEAGRCHRLAEQMQMDSATDQMFGGNFIRNDAEIYALGGALGEVEQIIHRLDVLCSKYPGWQPNLRLAHAERARLLGDLDDALTMYQEALELVEPLRSPEGAVPEWYWAAAGKLDTLLELGLHGRAVQEGRRFLELVTPETTHAREIRFHGIIRALALAESGTGDSARALDRLEPAIERRKELGSAGVFVGMLYEARALIALAGGDRKLYDTSAALACQEFCLVDDSAFYVRARRLLETPLASKSATGPA